MVEGILYCLNLDLSMDFRVRSRSPVTFKRKLYVTTVNNSFQSLPIFYHKELQLRCCIGLDLNNVTWSTKILKGTGDHPSPTPSPLYTHIHTHTLSSATLGKYLKLTLLDALTTHLQRFFIKLSFLYLISNGLNRVSFNLLTKIVALL